MSEYLCTKKDYTRCVGYHNGQCITFENCMYKKEKEMIQVDKIRKCTGNDCWGNYEYDYFYVVKNGDKVIYESKDDPTELIKIIKTLN